MIDRGADVQLTVRGNVPEQGAEYALGKIRGLVSRTPGRVGRVHVVVALGPNPAHEAPASVEAEVDLPGEPVHVHAAAAELTEAVDEAVDRLRRQLTDRRERARSHRRTARPQPVAEEDDQVREEQDHG